MHSELRARDDDVTRLLLDRGDGNREVFRDLVALLYDQLLRLAAYYLSSEHRNHSLQPTDLLHEVFCRLLEAKRIEWKDRRHFFAVAGRTMHRTLVDHARRRNLERHWGGLTRIPLDDFEIAADEKPATHLALHDALDGLAESDPYKARIVELRFFAGLSLEATAEILGTSRASVVRHWRVTRAWLHRELEMMDASTT